MLSRRKTRLTIAFGIVCTIGAGANAEAQSPIGPGANTQSGPGANPPGVHDLCIHESGSAGYVVLRAPKIQLNCCPLDAAEVNNCVPLNGFEVGMPTAGMVTGTGCVDSQGNSFLYHYVYHNQYFLERWFQGYFESAVCRFPLGHNEGVLDGHKGILGDCRGTDISSKTGSPSNVGTFPARAVLWFCNGENVPGGLQPQ